MRKAFTFILSVFYLITTTGVVINMHYCMNRFDFTQFYAEKNDICDKCGMHVEDSKGCCRDEIKVVKLQNDQKVSSDLSFDFKSFEPEMVKLSKYISILFYNSHDQLSHHNQSPPLLNRQDTYLQNCVFRI